MERTGQRDVMGGASAAVDEAPLLISAGELQGRRIVGVNDEAIGSVDDVLIDYDEHSVRYVTADVGGFLGIGSRTVAIPFESLQWRGDDLFLGVDRDTLENAPEYRSDARPSRGYESAVHEAWGLSPYWLAGGYGSDHTHWRASDRDR